MLRRIDAKDREKLKKYLLARRKGIGLDILTQAQAIIDRVIMNQDAALLAYTEQFDGVHLESLRVSDAEIKAAEKLCKPAFRKALQNAAKNILSFHEAQKQNNYILQREDGIYLGQRVLPLESVGVYVPGGRAQYPSSVLMNVIPAKVAGVSRIVMVTPPQKDGSLSPNILYAAKLAGVDEIYKVGGAQAIAALAYGTETIKRVDKIVGPGNIYVAAAKKLVYGTVDIDMIAGPSEILVVADSSADPVYVAADLLSQAEHDPMASAILLTDCAELADQTDACIREQMMKLPKKEIVEDSLADYSACIVFDSIKECIDCSNEIAPEHLELAVEDPMRYLSSVRNAGSVFLGKYTCETIGDYYGGTNHVLPTSGTARFSSALGVDAFIRKSSFLHYTEEALRKAADDIITLAEEEDLEGHANAVKVRVKA